MASRGANFRAFLGVAVMTFAPAVAPAGPATDSRLEKAAFPDRNEVPSAEAEALETKNIFGFTSGTDIGPEYDRQIELQTELDFGKRGGAYLFGEQKATLEYNPTAWLEIDTGFHGDFSSIRGSAGSPPTGALQNEADPNAPSNQIQGVAGPGGRSGVNFGGLHQKYTFVLIHRAPATPVGLAVSVEPEWSRVNDDGRIHIAFTSDTRIIVDTELVPATLYASLNGIYEPEVERDFGIPDWRRRGSLGFAGALAYRVDPAVARGPKHVVLGAELEYFRTYEGLGLSRYSGDALLFGPTFYVDFNETLFLAGAISTQIAGRAVGDPGPLNLAHFTRNKAQLILGINF
jgi:hypothetical protein